MTNYAVTAWKKAPLDSEFGMDYATKLFGAAVIAQLPRYQRGPKKGQVKAWLHWMKAEKGGWYRAPDGRGASGVAAPGLVRAFIGPHAGAVESDALRAHWLGMVQPLAGDRMYLSEEGRAAEMKRKLDYRLEQIAELETAAAQHEALAASCDDRPQMAEIAAESRRLAETKREWANMQRKQLADWQSECAAYDAGADL